MQNNPISPPSTFLISQYEMQKEKKKSAYILAYKNQGSRILNGVP